VVIKCQDLDILVFEDLLPGVAFIIGEPDGIIIEADKYGRRVLEVGMLSDRRGEIELEGMA